MAVNEYDLGAAPTVFVTFTNRAGEGRDPSNVQITVAGPDGATESFSAAVDEDGVVTGDPEIARPEGAGYFEAALAPRTRHGDYRYEWKGTGRVTATGTGVFMVRSR